MSACSSLLRLLRELMLCNTVKKQPRKVQVLLELLLVVVVLEEAAHHHVLVVVVPRLRRKVLEVLLDLRRVEGALGRKQLEHRRFEEGVVLVVLVVEAQLDKVEQQLRAAGCDRPAEQRQERLIVVGQRALRHKQRAVAACVLVQHHSLLALGVAAPERVLRPLGSTPSVEVWRKVARALEFTSGGAGVRPAHG